MDFANLPVVTWDLETYSDKGSSKEAMEWISAGATTEYKVVIQH